MNTIKCYLCRNNLFACIFVAQGSCESIFCQVFLSIANTFHSLTHIFPLELTWTNWEEQMVVENSIASFKRKLKRVILLVISSFTFFF